MAQVKIFGWKASLTLIPPTLALVHCLYQGMSKPSLRRCTRERLGDDCVQFAGDGGSSTGALWAQELAERSPQRRCPLHYAPRVESSTNRAVTRPPCTLRKGLKRCNPSGMHNCTFIINCLPKKLPYNYQEILTRIETLRESAHIFKWVHVVPSFHCFEIIFALPKQWRLFTHCHQQGGWKVW